MNLGRRQLETFRLFARTQSVTETARLMRVSQPAVSQTLKELETQFGFSLFVRSNGRTRLTLEANNVLPDVERLFAQMATLRGKAEELKDMRAGALSIASVPSFTARILPTALQAFRTSSPEALLVEHTRCSSTGTRTRPSTRRSERLSGGPVRSPRSRLMHRHAISLVLQAFSGATPRRRRFGVPHTTLHLRKAQGAELRSAP